MITETDGRRVRGQVTRTKILRAARDLIEETNEKPLMATVATRSGVVLRTVYHHFEDADAVIRQALSLHPRRNLVVTYKPAEAQKGSLAGGTQ